MSKGLRYRALHVAQVALVCAALVGLCACKPAGASSGPNSNTEALNAHDGVAAGAPQSEYAPAYLYDSNAPRPNAQARGG